MGMLVEKKLSYTIVGVLYDVYNELGGGYQEKYYQRAVAKELKDKEVSFVEQVKVPLTYKDESIGRYFLDFLIEDRIILEIKSGPQLYSRDTKQVLAYLKSKNIPLGILANFGTNKLYTKRILKGN